MNKVCRTCLKVLNNEASCLSLDSVSETDYPTLRNKLSVCVPELALDAIEYAVICTFCVEALNTSYLFKNKCLQTEQKILDFTRTKGCTKDTIDISDFADFTSLKLMLGNNGERSTTLKTKRNCKRVKLASNPDSELESIPEFSPSGAVKTYSSINKSIKLEPNTDGFVSPEGSFDISKIPQSITIKSDLGGGEVHVQPMEFYNTSDFTDGGFSTIKLEPGIGSGNVTTEDFETATNHLINSIPFNPELDVEIRTYNTPNKNLSKNSPTQNNSDVIRNSFQCVYCQQEFTILSQLETHLAGHAMLNRPLKCEMCERRFVRKDKLMLHMRIHTGEKPFKCNECGRCFSRKDKLNNHMRTHTGEKPHQCILCQKSFARKDKMNLHMKSQHWMALSNLEITVVKYAENANAMSQSKLIENLPKTY